MLHSLNRCLVGFLTCLSLTGYSVEASAGAWSVETVDSVGPVGQYTSLVVVDDEPWIVYKYGDAQTVDQLRCARRVGNTWQIETIDTGEAVGHVASAVSENDGSVLVAYQLLETIPGSSALFLATYDGASWQHEAIDISTDVVSELDLDIDSGGNPHVAYYSSSDETLRYGYRNDGVWTIETVADGGLYSSIALDSNERPHVAHFRAPQQNSYAWKPQEEWVVEDFSPAATVTGCQDLVIDESDQLHLAYRSRSVNGLWYAVHDGSGWAHESVELEVFPEDASLVVGPTGVPHVSYYAETVSNGVLKVARRLADWEIEIVDDAGTVGQRSSMALDSEGGMHISYFDHDNLDLKYAYGQPSANLPSDNVPILLLAPLAPPYPNPSRHTTDIAYSLPTSGPATLAVYDALGRNVVVLRDGFHQEGQSKVTWNGTDSNGRVVPAGRYMIRLQAAGAAGTTTVVRVR